jgi:hypothetical protein
MRPRPLLGLVLLAHALAILPAAVDAQQPARLLRGPYLQRGIPTAVVVRWRTDLPTDSVVRYGPAPDLLLFAAAEPLPAIDHEVELTGLAPGTVYYYSVGSSLGTLAGGDEQHVFATAPLPGAGGTLRIWAFGDAGPHLALQREVRAGYERFAAGRRADVWLLLGDNAYVDGSDRDYQEHLFAMYPAQLRQTVVWPVFGNHEAGSSFSEQQLGPYYDIFTLPAAGEAGGAPSGTEAYYAFDAGDVHFITLNSQDVDRSAAGAMLAWLREDLARNQRRWTIAFFHHPPYSKGSHDSDNPADSGGSMRDMRETFLPVLEEAGVDLVLTGHSHSYERSILLDGHYGTSDTLSAGQRRDGGDGAPGQDGAYRKTDDLAADAHAGTVYAVAGSAGSTTGGSLDHPAMVASLDVLGSLVLDVAGDRLDGVFVDAHGEVRDRFTLLKAIKQGNAPPLAVADAVVTERDHAVVFDVRANDTDPDLDGLTVTGITQPSRGAAEQLDRGRVRYTSAAGFTGRDAFTYTVMDEAGAAAGAEVALTVTCPPLAAGRFADDLEPGAEPGWSVDTAVNESPVSAAWAVVEDAATTSPTHAWSTDASAAAQVKDDRLVAPPVDLTSGSRLTFWHRFDLEEGFDGGVLEISTDGGARWTDLGPRLVAGGYNGTISNGDNASPIPRRAAWTGSSGAMRRVEVDLGPFAGPGRLVRWRLGCDFVTLEERSGWLVDDVDFAGLASGAGDCNLPPQPVDDAAATRPHRAVTVAVLANDSDPNNDPLTLAGVSDPPHGGAAANPDGTVTYRPDPGFLGTDVFTYTVGDGAGGTAVAQVTVLVAVHP